MKMKIIAFIIYAVILTGCGGTAENLKIGDPGPDFTLEDYQGNIYRLSEYKGKSPVIIYFYPKAGTSGCTTQACGVRDDYRAFEENGISILGISVDSKEDLKKFVDENNLNFPLLSDTDKKVSGEYGVLNNLGLSNRISFVIDKEGIIQSIIKDVDVNTHADVVLNMAMKLK